MKNRKTKMRCYNCGGTYIEKSGTLKMDDEVFGRYELENAVWYQCDKCNEGAYPYETCKRMDVAEKKTNITTINDLGEE